MYGVISNPSFNTKLLCRGQAIKVYSKSTDTSFYGLITQVTPENLYILRVTLLGTGAGFETLRISIEDVFNGLTVLTQVKGE